jgi:hypothetical protein
MAIVASAKSGIRVPGTTSHVLEPARVRPGPSIIETWERLGLGVGDRRFRPRRLHCAGTCVTPGRSPSRPEGDE